MGLPFTFNGRAENSPKPWDTEDQVYVSPGFLYFFVFIGAFIDNTADGVTGEVEREKER